MNEDRKKIFTKYLVDQKYRDTIGEYTYGNPRIYDWDEGTTIRIGKFCSIARKVVIHLGGNHRIDWITTYPFSYIMKPWPEAQKISGHPATKGDVIIGNDVWIGYAATVLSGVTIGDGAVIGACSVVTKDIQPYTIVAGNPARDIRKRFDESTIERLLKLQWWNWHINRIRSNLHLLCSPNIDTLIENNRSIDPSDYGIGSSDDGFASTGQQTSILSKLRKLFRR